MAADRAGLTFPAMGTDAHVIVVGGPIGLERVAQEHIAELERRWSRFVEDSEISALNRFAGAPVKVSRDTVDLVERAIDAWRLTDGRFDPTVLGSVVRAGYDRSFETLGPVIRPGSSELTLGAGEIEIVDDMIRLPVGTGFDPGGIGKGLAADIVAAELAHAGAEGACINLGGDVRVFGPSPRGDAWTIAVDHPFCDEPITRIGITNGAAATSTTLRRQWRVNGDARHHLIDTATGLPSTSDLTFVTVVAGNAWAAEVLAKAVLLSGRPHHFDLLATTGTNGLAIDAHGHVEATPGLTEYLGTAPLPETITACVIRATCRVMTMLPWYVARASGLVGWGLLAAATLWGLALSTKALGPRPRPNWLLDLHRWLGGLALIFTGVHVGSLLLDTYVHFGLTSVLVPFASDVAPDRGRLGSRIALPVARRRADFPGPTPALQADLAPGALREFPALRDVDTSTA